MRTEDEKEKKFHDAGIITYTKLVIFKKLISPPPPFSKLNLDDVTVHYWKGNFFE